MSLLSDDKAGVALANKIPLPKSLPQGEGLFSSPPCEEGAREWVDCHEVATKKRKISQ
ncbi:hypothetical protein [Helicobacter sp. T3_23-1059]